MVSCQCQTRGCVPTGTPRSVTGKYSTTVQDIYMIKESKKREEK